MGQTPPPEPRESSTAAPPRAFTQGAGLVFQVVGGALFLLSATVCCGSSLLSKEFVERRDWTTFGWSLPGDPAGHPSYSAQRAASICMFAAVGLGLALAGTGLGMQATRRHAPAGAVVVAAFGTLFWLTHAVFAAQHFRSWLLTVGAAGLALLFALLTAIAVGAWRDMWRDPPPRDHEVLPKDYKVPYSHYHEDPPDVRLAREIEERRRRLEVQQKELEMLEDRARKAREEREGEGRGRG